MSWGSDSDRLRREREKEHARKHPIRLKPYTGSKTCFRCGEPNPTVHDHLKAVSFCADPTACRRRARERR